METMIEPKPNIGFVHFSELPVIAEMEQTFAEDPLGIEEIADIGRHPFKGGGVVAHDGDSHFPIGYILFNTSGGTVHIRTWLLHPDYRRQGIGRRLFEFLVNVKLLRRFKTVCVEVRDTDLGVHHFLKKLGFRALKVFRRSFSDPEADGYLFCWSRSNTVAKDEKQWLAKRPPLVLKLPKKGLPSSDSAGTA